MQILPCDVASLAPSHGVSFCGSLLCCARKLMNFEKNLYLTQNMLITSSFLPRICYFLSEDQHMVLREMHTHLAYYPMCIFFQSVPLLLSSRLPNRNKPMHSG